MFVLIFVVEGKGLGVCGRLCYGVCGLRLDRILGGVAKHEVDFENDMRSCRWKIFSDVDIVIWGFPRGGMVPIDGCWFDSLDELGLF